MKKYMLFTWPSSQPFIGVEGCVLLLPPPNDINGSLDSAYMVPTAVAEKVNKELLQNGMEVVLPESDTLYTRKSLKKGAKKEDYLDYDGNIFSPVKKKFRLDVIFGEQASRMASDEGIKKTIDAIKNGKIDGSYASYGFSTEKDRDNCIDILSMHDGWLGNYWERRS